MDESRNWKLWMTNVCSKSLAGEGVQTWKLNIMTMTCGDFASI